MKKELWFVTGWYSAPLFCALAEQFAESYQVRFIAHDSYSHQYLLNAGMSVFKRSQKSVRVEKSQEAYYESIGVMDVAFTAQGFGSREYWTCYYLKRAAGFYRWLSKLWDVHAPFAVVIWNGMWHYERIAADLAHERGIKTVYLENGYFPETAHIDPQGVNAKAEIIQTDSADLAPMVSEYELDQFLEATRASFSELKRYTQVDDLNKTLSLRRKLMTGVELLFCDLPFIGAEFFSKLITMFRAKHRRTLMSSDGQLPERYLFLPLQVSADSQLILNSSWIKTPGEIIEMLSQVLEGVAPEVRLVVKEHPMEDPLIRFDELARRYPSVYWASKGNLQELIEGAEAVVNINSSVGFQALLFGRPVLCLGTALYARSGLAVYCPDQDTLQTALINISAPDLALVKRFAYHLHRNYCCSYHRGAFSRNDIAHIMEKIYENLVDETE